MHAASDSQLSKYFAQKAPAGRLSPSKYDPNTLTRMPPTQYPLSGKAAPPPNSRDAFPSLQQGADPLGWTQGDPREPQGAQGYRRAPSAPLGGWAHGAPWGYTEAIPNGTPFRLEGIYEGKAIPSVRKPFEWKGRSEWMARPNAVPCVHTAAETPNRISADLVGFRWIRMDLNGFDRLY